MNKKPKVLLYGCGKRFSENLEYIEKKYCVQAIADIDFQKWGKYGQYDIVPPSRIPEYDFDKIVITPKEFQGILAVLQAMGVPNRQVELLICENEYGHKRQNVSMSPQYMGGIICRFNDICFYVKNRSDYMVMEDIFKKNGWDFYCKEKVVVVDIGMNIGLSCLYFANMQNVEQVYGFEPFSETYRQALDNFAGNPQLIQSKICPVNCGLTDKEREIEVSYNPLYTTNMRVDQGKRIYGESEEKVWIKTRSASAEIHMILKKHKEKNIVLKIDCEGSEYLIFQDLVRTGILKDIYMVLMETHDGRENEIKKQLEDFNFCYFDNYTGGFSGLGFIYALNLNCYKNRS